MINLIKFSSCAYCVIGDTYFTLLPYIIHGRSVAAEFNDANAIILALFVRVSQSNARFVRIVVPIRCVYNMAP